MGIRSPGMDIDQDIMVLRLAGLGALMVVKAAESDVTPPQNVSCI